jgi:hypothetical protein
MSGVFTLDFIKTTFMKLIILLLLMSSCAIAQHPKYVQLIANRERIRHYVPDMYRLVKQTTINPDGNVTDVPVSMEIGMTISPKAVAYVLNETEIEVKSYTLQPAKIDAGKASYIKGYVKDNGNTFNTWSIDGWIPLCIKNDTLLMQQTIDDITTTRYWKRR